MIDRRSPPSLCGCDHPEVEGVRCTLLSVESELRRLLSPSVTHVLLVAKGTDFTFGLARFAMVLPVHRDAPPAQCTASARARRRRRRSSSEAYLAKPANHADDSCRTDGAPSSSRREHLRDRPRQGRAGQLLPAPGAVGLRGLQPRRSSRMFFYPACFVGSRA